MTNSEHIALAVTSRTQQKKHVQDLRKQNIIPGVVYGHQFENTLIQLPLRDLLVAYERAGESTLVDLTLDDKEPIKVLIHNIGRDKVTDAIQHVDFYAVNMKEKVHAEVALHFVGEAPAVKALGGVLVKNRDYVSIKCLPTDLVSEVAVDISSLNTFEDAIHIKDITLPAAVEVLDDMELTVVNVAPPRSEEELADLDSEVSEDVSGVEGAQENKPAEGDADNTSKDNKESKGEDK